MDFFKPDNRVSIYCVNNAFLARVEPRHLGYKICKDGDDDEAPREYACKNLEELCQVLLRELTNQAEIVTAITSAKKAEAEAARISELETELKTLRDQLASVGDGKPSAKTTKSK